MVPRLEGRDLRVMWWITAGRVGTPSEEAEEEALKAKLGNQLNDYIQAYGAQSGGAYYYDPTYQAWACSSDDSLDHMSHKWKTPVDWALQKRPAIAGTIADTWEEASTFVGYDFKT